MSTAAPFNVSSFILCASDDSLSAALALIEELSLFNLMTSKGSQWIEKASNKVKGGSWQTDSDPFQEKLLAKTKEFAGLSRGERLLKAIGSLQALLDLQPRDLRGPLDLPEMADDICVSAVRNLRADRDSGFSGSDTASLIEFQLRKTFTGLNFSLGDLSTEQQQHLVESVQKFVQSLPEDQQRFIMGKLGTADLSEGAIKQAIASGTIWTAFAAAVQFFGFAFYTTAAHLLAVVSLNLLPFGAYVGLSSTIAVLSSAWMLPILAGLGIWYYVRKNRSLRTSMAPLMITSLCLSGMEVQKRDPARRDAVVGAAVGLWRIARDLRDERRSSVAAQKIVRDTANRNLQEIRNDLRGAHQRQDKAVSTRKKLTADMEREVLSSLPAIAGGRWGSAMSGHGTRVLAVESHIQDAVRRRQAKSGVLGVIRGYLQYSVDATALRIELIAVRASLVKQVFDHWSPSGYSYPEHAASVLKQIDACASEIQSIAHDINRLVRDEQQQQGVLSAASAELTRRESACSEAENRYFGIGRV